MFYAISGIYGDYEAYKRALAKLKFQNLDDIKEEDIMNEDAVINTLEGEDVLYVVGNIIGAGGGSIKILQDMMSRDNIIAVVGGNEYKITQSLKALDDHIRNTSTSTLPILSKSSSLYMKTNDVWRSIAQSTSFRLAAFIESVTCCPFCG